MKELEIKTFSYLIPSLLFLGILIAEQVIQLNLNIFLFVILNSISIYFTPYKFLTSDNIEKENIISNLFVTLICSYSSLKILNIFSNNTIDSIIVIIYTIYNYYLIHNREKLKSLNLLYFHIIVNFFTIGLFTVI